MTATTHPAALSADRPAPTLIPLVVAGVVGLQLVAALVILALGDGPVGAIETGHEWVNQLAPAYTILVWSGASWWVAYWGGLVATFLALPVGLLVDRLLRRSDGHTRLLWWTLLWLSVVATIGFQAVGTLDALQIIGQPSR